MTAIRGFHVFFSKPPELPEHRHEKIARRGSPEKRLTLSGQENVSAAVFEILANDADAQVRMSVAVNDSAPAATLASLACRYPELVEAICMNPYAPPEVKERGAFCWLTEYSLERFLADKDSSEAEAILLFKDHRRRMNQSVRRARKAEKAQGSPLTGWEPPRMPLLGEVWATIRPPGV